MLWTISDFKVTLKSTPIWRFIPDLSPTFAIRGVGTKAKVRELLRDIREPLLHKMREKLISDEGRRKYFMRQYIIEPVFWHLKFNVGYRNFLLRGLEKVRAEFKLMCIGWNLKKMLKLGTKPATA